MKSVLIRISHSKGIVRHRPVPTGQMVTATKYLGPLEELLDCTFCIWRNFFAEGIWRS